MKSRIVDWSTEESRTEYIVGVDFKEEAIILSYADGTELPVLHPTEENVLYYRKQIEREIKEVLNGVRSEANKKLLVSNLSILGNILIMGIGMYLTSNLMEESMLPFLVNLLLLGATFLSVWFQTSRMTEKIIPVKDTIRAYKLFFKYQEDFEKYLNIHIENVYELGLTHMMSAYFYMNNNIPKGDEGSSLRLSH